MASNAFLYSRSPATACSFQSKPKPVVETKYFAVMYCKRSNKKHKSYQDGVSLWAC